MIGLLFFNRGRAKFAEEEVPIFFFLSSKNGCFNAFDYGEADNFALFLTYFLPCQCKIALDIYNRILYAICLRTNSIVRFMCVVSVCVRECTRTKHVENQNTSKLLLWKKIENGHTKLRLSQQIQHETTSARKY